MSFGNLRGISEAGRVFALPTYLFAGSLLAMIVTGLIRELAGGGLPRVVPGAGTVGIGSHSGLIAIGAVYIMAKAFANGGSSLTGIEAVSNAVSALRPPEGRHARQILATQGTPGGGADRRDLLAGARHPRDPLHVRLPHRARPGGAGRLRPHRGRAGACSSRVQAATAAILFTGGNTSFTGFPFLASFVAEDSFLPRWLGKRGHRLAFSNGILLLAGLSVALMLVAGATVDALIPFYAIGVFTGFAMAGFGMARYHRRTREPGWRRKLAINLAGGIYTALVVLLFAVVKFTEGAWLIVIVFPVLVFLLIRLNREYRAEATCLANTAHRAPGAAAQLLPPGRAAARRRLRPGDHRGAQVRAEPAAHRAAGGALQPRQRPRRPAPTPVGRRAEPGYRLSWPTARTGGWRTPRPGWRPRSPPRRARTSPLCCRAAATRRWPGGCCTTTPPTGSPATSAASPTRPPRSSPSTSPTGSRRRRRSGPGCRGAEAGTS